MTREILPRRAGEALGALTLSGVLPSVAAALLLSMPEWATALFASTIAAGAAVAFWRWTDVR